MKSNNSTTSKPRAGSDISRGRKLAPAKAAYYQQIRDRVEEEIPPAKINVVRQILGKLRQLREGQGLSFADMEKQTGMTRANLCRLESEGRNVQVRTLERYARALGCQIEIQVVPCATKASRTRGNLVKADAKS